MEIRHEGNEVVDLARLDSSSDFPVDPRRKWSGSTRWPVWNCQHLSMELPELSAEFLVELFANPSMCLKSDFSFRLEISAITLTYQCIYSLSDQGKSDFFYSCRPYPEKIQIQANIDQCGKRPA